MYVSRKAVLNLPRSRNTEIADFGLYPNLNKGLAIPNRGKIPPNYLNSSKVFLLLSERYYNPNWGLEPGTYASVSTRI